MNCPNCLSERIRLNGVRQGGKQRYKCIECGRETVNPSVGPDEELVATNVTLAKQNQKFQDLNRIERKAFRDHVRLENALEELNKSMLDKLSELAFTDNVPKISICKSKGAGIIQLSDLHFNELIDLDWNKYDFDIASKRLRKFAHKARSYLKSFHINNVVVAMTGDLLNSDRRLDEKLSMATNRTNAMFVATDLLQCFLRDLAKDFKLTVAAVSGNESRVQEEWDWNELVVGDNYDFAIFNLLKYLLLKHPNISFIKGDLTEQIVNVGGLNFLLTHGMTLPSNNLEKEIFRRKGTWSDKGVRVDYILMGHLHCLPENTDVLTRNRGFVPLKEMTIKDVCYGYRHGEIVESQVNNVIRGTHTGKMYSFDNVFCHQMMTDGHYIYTKDDKYMPIKDFCIEYPRTDLVKSAKPLQIATKEEHLDDFLRLLVATAADSYYDRSTKIPGIRFHLVKARKITRLTKLINSLGYTIHWSKQKKGSYKNTILDIELRAKIFNALPDKQLPDWFLSLSARQRNVIVEELQYWDGCPLTKREGWIPTFQFASMKPREVDLVQQLLLSVGIVSHRLEARPNTITYNYRKDWKKDQKNTRLKPKVSTVKNEPVGCLETSTHNFFIRTASGHIELTGNSARISDTYGRSSSLCGDNVYSSNALGLKGRASQNVYIITEGGDLDGIKVDLQETNNVIGYIDYSVDNIYNVKSVDKAKKKLNINHVKI